MQRHTRLNPFDRRPTTLLDPIQTYFTAQAPQDAARFTAAFAPDAVVYDEGGSHRGQSEILAWWQAAEAKYHPRAEPLERVEAAGSTHIRARVSGDFPGSPIVLSFRFEMRGGLIGALRIG